MSHLSPPPNSGSGTPQRPEAPSRNSSSSLRELLPSLPSPSLASFPVLGNGVKRSKSLFERFIMTPLLFISFIVSLFLVDKRKRPYNPHSPTAEKRITISTVSHSRWHTVKRLLWFRRDGNEVEVVEIVSEKTSGGEYFGGRHVMRREMDEAFTMQQKVMNAMLMMALGAVLLVCLGMSTTVRSGVYKASFSMKDRLMGIYDQLKGDNKVVEEI